MKSKAPLVLLEQLVMLAVFALAAALCLQAFVQSDRLSRGAEERDRAVILCQSAAEAIRASEGNLSAAAVVLELPFGAYANEGLPFEAHYREDWTISADREYAYCLRAERDEDVPPGMGKARVWVEGTHGSGKIFELEVAWPEGVSADE